MEEKLTFEQAFIKMQSELPLIKKTENNPFFKSKYAGLPSILEVVLPILHENGFSLKQYPVNEGERVGVATEITHAESGDSMSSSFTLQLAKNDPQGAGSAITYARRYAIITMLSLNVDEDDDANEASTKPKGITKVEAIKKLTACVTLEELKTVFTSLGNIASDVEIIALKDELKTTLL